MMSSFYAKDVKCPYYQYDDPASRAIICESVLPESTIKSRFRSKNALEHQIIKRCAGDFKGCPWYQVVSIKYEQS